MNKVYYTGVLSSLLLIVACGGDGTVSTPTPTPTPTPASAFPLSESSSFQTITGDLSYTGKLDQGLFEPGGDAVMGRHGVMSLSPVVTFSYDREGDIYAISNVDASATFGAADRSDSSDYSVSFSKQEADVTDTLTLYGNAQASAPTAAPQVQLSYTSYGFWSHSVATSARTENTYFVFGQKTGEANLPSAGTASYQTTVSAYMFQSGAVKSRITDLIGSATFSADFGNATVSTEPRVRTC